MIKINHLTKHTTRIFTQHDHGLLSGELAHAFIDPMRGERLPMPLVMAIAAHDLGWDHIDDFEALPAEAIPFDATIGALDFLKMPYSHKIPIYLDGIARCEALHPYAGLLISLHYTAFLDEATYGDIITSERARRVKLAAQLGFSGPRDPRILEDYERLKFFDLISLFICMRAPDHDHSTCPAWISHSLTLLEHAYTLAWHDAHTLTIDPFPFDEPLSLTLPYRDLPDTAMHAPNTFKLAWESANTEHWRLTIKALTRTQKSTNVQKQ